MRVRGRFAGLLLLALVAVACTGGDNDDSNGPTGPSSTEPARWSIVFGTSGNGLNVSACGVTVPGGFCSQLINVGANGAFNDTWSPATPNTLRAEGTLSASSVSATLRCVNTAATGSLSATRAGADYTGTATLSGDTVPIRVVQGIAPCSTEVVPDPDPDPDPPALWTIVFGTSGNGLNVSACGVTVPGGFCGQSINVGANGAFNDTWSPATPTVRAEGTLSASSVSATLRCVNTAATGSLSATRAGADYTGTATLSGSTVPIRVVQGPAPCEP